MPKLKDLKRVPKMRTCVRCDTPKDLKKDFYPEKSGRDGYSAFCKECNTDRCREKQWSKAITIEGIDAFTAKILKKEREVREMKRLVKQFVPLT